MTGTRNSDSINTEPKVAKTLAEKIRSWHHFYKIGKTRVFTEEEVNVLSLDSPWEEIQAAIDNAATKKNELLDIKNFLLNTENFFYFSISRNSNNLEYIMENRQLCKHIIPRKNSNEDANNIKNTFVCFNILKSEVNDKLSLQKKSLLLPSNSRTKIKTTLPGNSASAFQKKAPGKPGNFAIDFLRQQKEKEIFNELKEQVLPIDDLKIKYNELKPLNWLIERLIFTINSYVKYSMTLKLNSTREEIVFLNEFANIFAQIIKYLYGKDVIHQNGFNDGKEEILYPRFPIYLDVDGAYKIYNTNKPSIIVSNRVVSRVSHLNKDLLINYAIRLIEKIISGIELKYNILLSNRVKDSLLKPVNTQIKMMDDTVAKFIAQAKLIKAAREKSEADEKTRIIAEAQAKHAAAIKAKNKAIADAKTKDLADKPLAGRIKAWKDLYKEKCNIADLKGRLLSLDSPWEELEIVIEDANTTKEQLKEIKDFYLETQAFFYSKNSFFLKTFNKNIHSELLSSNLFPGEFIDSGKLKCLQKLLTEVDKKLALKDKSSNSYYLHEETPIQIYPTTSTNVTTTTTTTSTTANALAPITDATTTALASTASANVTTTTTTANALAPITDTTTAALASTTATTVLAPTATATNINPLNPIANTTTTTTATPVLASTTEAAKRKKSKFGGITGHKKKIFLDFTIDKISNYESKIKLSRNFLNNISHAKNLELTSLKRWWRDDLIKTLLKNYDAWKLSKSISREEMIKTVNLIIYEIKSHFDAYAKVNFKNKDYQNDRDLFIASISVKALKLLKKLDEVKPSFITQLENYKNNFSFYQSRLNSVERLLNLANDDAISHLDKAKILKVEYNAIISDDAKSELAKIINHRLKEYDLDDLDIAEKEDFSLTVVGAKELLEYISEQERSISYKRKFPNQATANIVNKGNLFNQLNEIGKLAHQLLLCKNNDDLKLFLTNSESFLGNGKKDTRLREIFEKVNRAINARFNDNEKGKPSIIKVHKGAEDRPIALYNDCFEILKGIETDRTIKTSYAAVRGRKLLQDKQGVSGSKAYPEKYTVKEELIGKLFEIAYNNEMDDETKCTEMRWTIELTKNSGIGMKMKGLFGIKGKLKDALEKLQIEIRDPYIVKSDLSKLLKK